MGDVEQDAGSTSQGASQWRPKATVEARQVTEDNAADVAAWVNSSGIRCDRYLEPAQVVIWVPDGRTMTASVGDWMIKGWRGEFWVTTAAEFAEAYDPAGVPSAADAALAVAKAALRRLSLIDEMAGMGQRDGDPELTARCKHAAGALATIDRLFAEVGETVALVMPPDEFAATKTAWEAMAASRLAETHVIVSRDDLRTVLADYEGFIGGKGNEAFSRLAAAAGVQ